MRSSAFFAAVIIAAGGACCGAEAWAAGAVPTVIGAFAVFVPRSIGVTVPPALFATYAVLPSGVMAIDTGDDPTGIGVPTAFVAALTGITASPISSTT